MKKGWEYTQEPALMNLKANYIQNADSECLTQADQVLKIWTENSGTDEPYLVIKTDRWAFDNIEDLINLLNDFKSRYDL